MQDFKQLGISEDMETRLNQIGINEPTPIQKKAIPLLLDGKDLTASAQTGTGKTFAFTIPIMERIIPGLNQVQALIVTPTRELAIQVTTVVEQLIEQNDEIIATTLIGGQDADQQIRKLENGAQIVIGTPGRLLDHIRRGTLELSRLLMLVLDEADQMLHIGFLPDVESIIKETPANRQTMLFSATMPKEIRSIANQYMDHPIHVETEHQYETVKEIKQSVIETTDRSKQGALLLVIRQYRPYLGIIFCRTKRRVTKLNEALQANGFQSEELHGDLSQAKREQVMHRFREGEIRFLVATDVAARGLDVEGVTHVFNYDIPRDVDTYIHRIGRTGRAGGKGFAVTFVAPKDKSYLRMIEKGINQKINRKSIQ